ncbi:ATP-binding protein [Bacillus fonticola]|uniref:ATP-binding protein n=1 Tax=Bacillus fonticola TaxID=2728853 RepID=UPI001474EE15|nr:ATP-binding protein [Bacillus fonticola]
MKFVKRNFLLYCTIVLIPTITLLFVYVWSNIQENEALQNQQADWVASIHERQIDQFLMETVVSTEVLALSSSFLFTPSTGEFDELSAVLANVRQTDPRYGGIFVLDKNMSLVAGSNDDVEFPFEKSESIQQAATLKKTTISESVYELDKGQEVWAVASPITSPSNEVQGMVVSLLRTDSIRNILTVLTPNHSVVLLNGQGQPMIDLSKYSMIGQPWKSIPLERLPWVLNVQLVPVDIEQLVRSSFLIFMLVFVMTHILFIWIKYILLKRQTERERVQNEAQKLELVGTLAASTAHEIRNPLTGIKGLMQLFSEKYKSEEDQFYFSVIDKEVTRINEIVSEFLILGKPTAQHSELIVIDDCIREIQPLIQSEAHLHNVRYQFRPSNEALTVLGVRDQLKQVLLNLTKNSLEATGEGGVLEMTVLGSKKDVRIIIADNGIGMTKDELQKVFQPFYTSKDAGTGLGLVVCRRIIESFKGDIFIQSEKKIGTTVTVHLPLSGQQTFDEYTSPSTTKSLDI